MSSHYYCDCGKRWHDDESCPACHPNDFVSSEEYNLVCDLNHMNRDRVKKLISVLKEIITVSDRNHDSWKRAKSLIAEFDTGSEAIEK